MFTEVSEINPNISTNNDNSKKIDSFSIETMFSQAQKLSYPDRPWSVKL
jgi:hypothetical protein